MKRYPYLKCLLAVISASVILFGVTTLVTKASPVVVRKVMPFAALQKVVPRRLRQRD